MKHFNANGRSIARKFSFSKPKIGAEQELAIRRSLDRDTVFAASDEGVFNKGGSGLRYLKRLAHLFKSKNNRSRMLFGFIITISYMLFSDAQAQSAGERADAGVIKPLVIGQKVPEEFWTKEHLFYSNGDTVRKTLEEHRGKMLILDFWSSGCAPCMLHQKEISYFKERYTDKLTIVMVNSKKTKEDHEKIKAFVNSDRFKKFGIKDFSSVVEDGYLERLFSYSSFPTYIWINRQGIFQLHTFRNLLDKHYQAPYIERLP